MFVRRRRGRGVRLVCAGWSCRGGGRCLEFFWWGLGGRVTSMSICWGYEMMNGSCWN